MKFIFALMLILLVYGATNFYIGKRIFQGLIFLFPNMDARLYAVLFALFPLSLIVGRWAQAPGIKGVMDWLGSYWMGIFVYLLMFLFVADLMILLGSLASVIPRPVPQSVRFYGALIVLILTTAVVSYGIYHANQIKQVSYDIKIKKTVSEDPLQIVLISDLHLGAVNSEKRLERMVESINALNPDIVCLAGDIFDDDYHAIANPERASQLLQNIKSTYGVYGCLGNHDGGNTFKDMLRFLERSNITLLKDDYVVIDERLILLGRVDPSPIGGFDGLKRKDLSEVLSSIDPQDLENSNGTRRPIVVIDHNPSSIDEYGQEVDLILSGHTHQGQIFPFNFVTGAIFTVDYGHYQRDAGSPHVIVTSGVGTWGMPMRIGTNNEIVSILLHSDQTKDEILDGR